LGVAQSGDQVLDLCDDHVDRLVPQSLLALSGLVIGPLLGDTAASDMDA